MVEKFFWLARKVLCGLFGLVKWIGKGFGCVMYKVNDWITGLLDTSDDNAGEKLRPLFHWALGITILFLLVDIGLVVWSLKYQKEFGGFGQFGDFFGGLVNPILTFLTFMGLLITIVLQQKELKLTREELKISSQALREQAETQEMQRFENTFFSLLEHHNLMLRSYLEKSQVLKEKIKGVTNDDCLTIFYKPDASGRYSFEAALENVRGKFVYRNRNYGTYFRILYQLLKFVAVNIPGGLVGKDFNESTLRTVSVSEKEKTYSNIVRSYLTSDILQLLAVKGASKNPV
jgi:hypothetical protein